MSEEYGPWTGWNGGECPVEPDELVIVCTATSGMQGPAAAGLYDWSTQGKASGERPKSAGAGLAYNVGDIIAYRVKREPVVETIRVELWNSRRILSKDLLARGTVQTRDGIPDMTTLRWEDA